LPWDIRRPLPAQADERRIAHRHDGQNDCAENVVADDFETIVDNADEEIRVLMAEARIEFGL
jgi:hypothetical protein